MNEIERLIGSESYNLLKQKLGGFEVIIDDGKLVPKHRFDCINLSLKDHKERVQLLEIEIERLKAENKQINSIKEELTHLINENCILKILFDKKARNLLAVQSLITTDNLNGVELRESVIKQINKLKKQEPYLFYDEQQLFKLVPYKSKNFKLD